jgi:hypothetical protein
VRLLTLKDVRRLALREKIRERQARERGNKKEAFLHFTKALNLPFDHHRAMVRRHARSRMVAAFRSADGGYVEVIHPDVKNKGRWRVTSFHKDFGPSGHIENLTKEQAIREIGQSYSPVSHKRAFAGWPVLTWTRRNPSRRKRKACR